MEASPCVKPHPLKRKAGPSAALPSKLGTSGMTLAGAAAETGVTVRYDPENLRRFDLGGWGELWGYHRIPESNHASNARRRRCIVRTTYLALLPGCRVSRTRVPRRIAISSSP